MTLLYTVFHVAVFIFFTTLSQSFILNRIIARTCEGNWTPVKKAVFDNCESTETTSYSITLRVRLNDSECVNRTLTKSCKWLQDVYTRWLSASLCTLLKEIVEEKKHSTWQVTEPMKRLAVRSGWINYFYFLNSDWLLYRETGKRNVEPMTMQVWN